MCVSAIGFQLHSHGPKRNILREKKFGMKNHVLNQKSRLSGVLQKSVLDSKDTESRLGNNFTVLCTSERGQIPIKRRYQPIKTSNSIS